MPETIETPEDLVRMASGVLEAPTLEEVEAMLTFMSQQDRDFAISGIEDTLLDIRASLLELEAAESPEPDPVLDGRPVG